jgi:hypothetical protein
VGAGLSHLLLAGPSGTGKGTLVHALAEQSEAAVVDLDVGQVCCAGRAGPSQSARREPERFKELAGAHDLERAKGGGAGEHQQIIVSGDQVVCACQGGRQDHLILGVADADPYVRVWLYREGSASDEREEGGDLLGGQTVTLDQTWTVEDGADLLGEIGGQQQLKAPLAPVCQEEGREAARGDQGTDEEVGVEDRPN